MPEKVKAYPLCDWPTADRKARSGLAWLRSV
jgi:hypothetical protein